MPISLKHAFVSGKADGADSTLVQPSSWNAEHALTMASARLLGRTTGGVGLAEELTVGAGLTLGSGSLVANLTSVAGRTGAVTLAVADVSGAAPLASPTFTGTPAAPTATAGTNTTQLATTAFVANAVSTATANKLTPMTSQAATSGTSRDFTAIPATARRVTVLLQGVSLSGTALLRIQLGTSSGFVTTGYVSTGSVISAGAATAAATAGFEVYTNAPNASYTMNGAIVFHLLTGNTWVASGTIGWGGVAWTGTLGGHIALAAALTQVRVTSSNGTDTFDAGNINVFYE